MSMRIYFERSGGFMGLQLRTAVDTSALPEDEAQNLQQLVDETHFFELPAVLDGSLSPDEMAYKLTVKRGEREHTIETTDVAAPEELRPLLRRLTVLARRYPAAMIKDSDAESED